MIYDAGKSEPEFLILVLLASSLADRRQLILSECFTKEKTCCFSLLEQQDLDQKAVAPEMLESFSVVARAVLAIFYPSP